MEPWALREMVIGDFHTTWNMKSFLIKVGNVAVWLVSLSGWGLVLLAVFFPRQFAMFLLWLASELSSVFPV